MSILDLEYKNKINDINKRKLLNNDFLEKSLEFKNVIDDFNLIKQINDSFFIDLYKKNFSDILEFELSNDFNYSHNFIYDIEESIENLSLNKFIKYDKILDYMLLKACDLDEEYYGSIINFILNLFKDVKDNLEFIDEVKKIWKNKYSDKYPRFSEFQRSSEFEEITLLLLNKDELKDYNLDFSSPDKKFIYDFLIFTSNESDFFVKEVVGSNVNSFLFDDKKEFYKKNGNNMLLDIKNKIILYN